MILPLFWCICMAINFHLLFLSFLTCLVLFLYSSCPGFFVDVPLIVSFLIQQNTYHYSSIPNWQQKLILLGMVEALSADYLKSTHTQILINRWVSPRYFLLTLLQVLLCYDHRIPPNEILRRVLSLQPATFPPAVFRFFSKNRGKHQSQSYRTLLPTNTVNICVCVCVFSSHPFWTSSSLDVPAGGTQVLRCVP